MQNALYVGLSRQIALHREMDVIANNLANMDTNGFKADGVTYMSDAEIDAERLKVRSLRDQACGPGA